MTAALTQIVRFSVPVKGRSFAVAAQMAIMADGEKGLHSFVLQPPPLAGLDDAARVELAQVIGFLNSLIDAGLPWSALATCRASRGVIGALVEAADNRLTEVMGCAT